MEKVLVKVVGCSIIAAAIAELMFCGINFTFDKNFPDIVFWVPLIIVGLICCLLFGAMIFYAVFIEK